jgi:hypothetical protein
VGECHQNCPLEPHGSGSFTRLAATWNADCECPPCATPAHIIARCNTRSTSRQLTLVRSRRRSESTRCPFQTCCTGSRPVAPRPFLERVLAQNAAEQVQRLFVDEPGQQLLGVAEDHELGQDPRRVQDRETGDEPPAIAISVVSAPAGNVSRASATATLYGATQSAAYRPSGLAAAGRRAWNSDAMRE